MSGKERVFGSLNTTRLVASFAAEIGTANRRSYIATRGLNHSPNYYLNQIGLQRNRPEHVRVIAHITGLHINNDRPALPAKFPAEAIRQLDNIFKVLVAVEKECRRIPDDALSQFLRNNTRSRFVCHLDDRTSFTLEESERNPCLRLFSLPFLTSGRRKMLAKRLQEKLIDICLSDPATAARVMQNNFLRSLLPHPVPSRIYKWLGAMAAGFFAILTVAWITFTVWCVGIILCFIFFVLDFVLALMPREFVTFGIFELFSAIDKFATSLPAQQLLLPLLMFITVTIAWGIMLSCCRFFSSDPDRARVPLFSECISFSLMLILFPLFIMQWMRAGYRLGIGQISRFNPTRLSIGALFSINGDRFMREFVGEIGLTITKINKIAEVAREYERKNKKIIAGIEKAFEKHSATQENKRSGGYYYSMEMTSLRSIETKKTAESAEQLVRPDSRGNNRRQRNYEERSLSLSDFFTATRDEKRPLMAADAAVEEEEESQTADHIV